jgi:mono/diheme cytochrome c family protein
MTPRRIGAVLSLGLAALAGGCGTSPHAEHEADRRLAHARVQSMPESKTGSPVHIIAMPHDEPVFPPGPGRDAFVTACVVCHSPRYITMQPPFSRAAWLSEVNKMKDTYGAHISDEQVHVITGYLVFIDGASGGPHAAKGVTYGE